MKGTITVVASDIKLTLHPETDIERLVFKELGDDMSISRCHHDIVLRRRGPNVHSLSEIDEAVVGIEAQVDLEDAPEEAAG